MMERDSARDPKLGNDRGTLIARVMVRGLGGLGLGLLTVGGCANILSLDDYHPYPADAALGGEASTANDSGGPDALSSTDAKSDALDSGGVSAEADVQIVPGGRVNCTFLGDNKLCSTVSGQFCAFTQTPNGVIAPDCTNAVLPKQGEKCTADQKCADGLVCISTYPVGDLVCTKVCKSKDDCTADYPYCNTPFGFRTQSYNALNLRACAKCDPTAPRFPPDQVVADCGPGTSCKVTSLKNPTVCAAGGSTAQNTACSTAADCGEHLMCVCTIGGIKAVGDDCGGAAASPKVGTCLKTCSPASQSSSTECVGGAVCTGVSGSQYSWCKL